MSKKHETSRIHLSLSAAAGKCKRAASKYWRLASQIVGARPRSRQDRLEVAAPKIAIHELHLGTCHSPVELREVAEVLSIGDRIRVFCDDGVVVAEKISPTQFKLLDCQMLPESVH
jgi:hypothetical protein